MSGQLLAVHLACEEYDGPTKLDFTRVTKKTPWLDVSATLDEEGFVNLAVVNIHKEKDLETDLGGVKGPVQTFVVRETQSTVQVLWQDGTREILKTTEIIPHLNPDEYECW